eukprot:gnl/MRDRNA2_/MRDRNA2_61883_c0_seq1.p1 gnl/MRDRNA2_/MRDRNA2_61883_c0~~gnl/MRDRNA2_/MRDRNA2_61883_c0_seq1.p1  ORF type:complete len:398 (+),score=97.29 gnl/MRDRNA2_/MRDRNA2_61883_c0_seq1:170-1195(+)
MKANFPETMGRLVFVNAPSFASWIYDTVAPMLDDAARAKIQIIGAGETAKRDECLREMIAEKDIPSFLGGPCQCAEKGPWNDRKIIKILESVPYWEILTRVAAGQHLQLLEEYEAAPQDSEDTEAESPDKISTDAADADHDSALAKAEAPFEGIDLKLEVVDAEGLADGEYRLGDFMAGLFGKKELNPYVVVKCGKQLQQSPPIGATLSEQGASAEFGWKTLVEVTPTDSGEAGQLSFRVLDKKGIQAVFRGDPLIGEATLALSPEKLTGDTVQDVLELRSGDEENRVAGRLRVQYKVVQSIFGGNKQWLEDRMGRIFDNSGKAPLIPVGTDETREEARDQ